jgi:2-oxo-4-hydroxy-4-carboxy-5-ureidoimidazoline decarboxylase
MPKTGPGNGRITLDDLNGLEPAEFVSRLGDVYEHSPWVARDVQKETPFPSLTRLFEIMQAAVTGASEEAQLELLRAHPDLAGKAALAGELTASSTLEQSSAGLDSLTPAEMTRFTALNDAYREKFEFPFVLAVRGADKSRILAAFEGRIGNDRGAEIANALAEVGKIAWLRLLDIVVPAATGKLTTHVLDTALGRPAGGMEIDLIRIADDGTRDRLGHFVTNADGRLDAPAMAGADLQTGTYEWLFHTADYFVRTGQPTDGPPFLDTIPIRFAIANPEAHYHVPLLVTPWAYSTYRGS